MKEQWRDYDGTIKAFHGLIRVSNLGRIYKKGTNTSNNQSGILKCTKTQFGYLRVHVSINGVDYNKPVHRLVAETWCPNPKNKPYVDHVNAIRDDNRASNLRWVTTAENCRNPHYISKLVQREHDRVMLHNWLRDSNLNPVVAEHKNGMKLYFKSMQDCNAFFKTHSNLQRIIRKGHYVKSRKSPYRGWRVRFVNRQVYEKGCAY